MRSFVTVMAMLAATAIAAQTPLYELLSRVYADHHIPMDVYYGKNIPPPRRGVR